MQGKDRSLEQQIAAEVFGRKSKFLVHSMTHDFIAVSFEVVLKPKSPDVDCR